MMWGWYGGDGSWVGWLVMAVFMLIFWALVVGGIVVLVRYIRSGEQRSGSDALRILDERFARGEIDADEYSRRRQLLGSH